MAWHEWNKSVRHIPGWLSLMLGLAVAVLLIRVFAIDSITIRTTANKPILQPGDFILVSKIHYGPRLPFTSRRLSGLRQICRGDLLAYHFPEGDSVLNGADAVSYYALKRKSQSVHDTLFSREVRYRSIGRREPEVSRCVGLPGDTIFYQPVTHDQIPVITCLPSTYNHLEAIDYSRFLAFCSYDYLVETTERPLSAGLVARLAIHKGDIQELPGLGCLLPLRSDQLSSFKEMQGANGLSPYIIGTNKGDYNIFPHDARYPWNRDNFGPVIVPRKGDSIRLTLLNLCIYQRIIEVYEHNRLEVHQDRIFINGVPTDTYAFKQDYYFVLGDSRHHARDSRHWGFLPGDHIIGKPVLIWFSVDNPAGAPIRVLWNRLFKTI